MSNFAFAPADFKNRNGDQITFVKIINANHDLTINVSSKTNEIKSRINFTARASGYPALYLEHPRASFVLNGVKASAHEESPDKYSSFKCISQIVYPGSHSLDVVHALNTNRVNSPIKWVREGLHCAFHMSDLNDPGTLKTGRFLGHYFPSNLEFDQYPFQINLKIENAGHEHIVFTNGNVNKLDKNKFSIYFPGHFTTSFPWIHIGPENEFVVLDHSYDSIDKRKINIKCYALKTAEVSKDLDKFQDVAKTSLKSLENTFGPFPYPKVLIFATGYGEGGMEYAGATATDLDSLRHELDHSYFARCIAPSGGDSGWIDEAIASWGDSGYHQSPQPPSMGANMGRRSEYIRETSSDAYVVGSNLLAYFDHLLRNKGGLRPVLRRYFQKTRFASTTNSLFKHLVEEALGKNLDQEFEKYVFTDPDVVPYAETGIKKNPHHFDDIAEINSKLFPT